MILMLGIFTASGDVSGGQSLDFTLQPATLSTVDIYESLLHG